MAQEICPMCGGSGSVVDDEANNTLTCDACKGEGWIETEAETET